MRLVEQFIRSDKIAIHPPLFYQDELRRRLIITLNMTSRTAVSARYPFLTIFLTEIPFCTMVLEEPRGIEWNNRFIF